MREGGLGADKIRKGWSEPGAAKDADLAKTAYLFNLLGFLKVELPPSKDLDPAEHTDRLLGLLDILEKVEDVPDKLTKDAHLAMSFPWSRSIISRCLFGEGGVTPLGIPASYGVK